MGLGSSRRLVPVPFSSTAFPCHSRGSRYGCQAQQGMVATCNLLCQHLLPASEGHCGGLGGEQEFLQEEIYITPLSLAKPGFLLPLTGGPGWNLAGMALGLPLPWVSWDWWWWGSPSFLHPEVKSGQPLCVGVGNEREGKVLLLALPPLLCSAVRVLPASGTKMSPAAATVSGGKREGWAATALGLLVASPTTAFLNS